MAVNPMLHAGANAINQGMKNLDSVAQEIAEMNIKSAPSANAGDGESQSSFTLEGAAEAIVDLKIYQRQVQAATKVVQTADEVLGFLLDIKSPSA